MSNNRAFTLIELLVVIAIIGILASVVLLRYPITIRRVKDSRVLTSLTQFRMQANLLKDNVGDYSDVANCDLTGGNCQCSSDLSFDILCKDIQENAVSSMILNVNSDNSGYCAVAYLADYNQYFCVDHRLVAKKFAVSPADPGNPCAPACRAANSCSCE